jgi:hypothetical protein
MLWYGKIDRLSCRMLIVLVQLMGNLADSEPEKFDKRVMTSNNVSVRILEFS